MTLVFVYGTLLAGQVNHHLLAGASCLGSHRTSARYTLYLLGAYPGLVAHGHTAVTGEVYRVDRAGLCALDRLESYPHLYRRVLLPTPWGRAWVYLYRGPIAGRQALPGGDWRGFCSAAAGRRGDAVRARPDAKNPSRRQALRRQSPAPTPATPPPEQSDG
ncbi:MAG: gamma-glutamylcyclotransferase [Chromatiaceae bacterium]|nr:MAG: gamma-glutamylcyclotransferase [Chromatiaceae bacterium]